MTSAHSPHLGGVRNLRSWRSGLAAGALAVLTTAVAACGSSAGGSSAVASLKPGTISRAYAGTTISVLVPPWESYPKQQLAQFTKLTGIKVNLQSLAWDSIHDKVVSSEAAHVAPADVTEVDWSWVGQFCAAGWYAPLGSYVTQGAVSGNIVAPVFRCHGQQMAMPYNLDFRVTYINVTDFRKAGINSLPTTWNELAADARQLKSKGVLQYPVGVPLSVTEGSSTPWYALTKSAGGDLFTSNGQPAFTSPGSPAYQALEFEKTLYQSGLTQPGSISLTDQQVSTLFQQGKVAIELSFSPANAAGYNDPSVSQIAKNHDQVALIPLPGSDGHRTGTFGLPEGLGIPKLSQHPGAAAMFINWSQREDVMTAAFKDPNLGNLPPTTTALHALNSQGLLVDGKQLLAILPTVKPLFPEGTPVWYPQFSNDAATMIQSVVQGRQQPGAALKALAAQAAALRGQSS